MKIKERYIFLIFLFLSLVFFHRFLTGARMIYGSDWLLAAWAKRQWVINAIKKTGHIPLWDPYIFCGMPTVGTFMGYIFSPQALFNFILPTCIIWNYTFLFYSFLAGCGMFLFLRELGLRKDTSFLGALAYMFSGILISPAYGGHDGRTIAISLAPFVFFFLERGIKREDWRYFVYTGAMLGYSFLPGHIQLTYYTGIAALSYGLYRVIRDKRRGKHLVRAVLFALLAFVVAMGIMLCQVLPAFANFKYAARGGHRGYEYATSWSMPTSEVLTLLIPTFPGVLDHYWGMNYFKLHTEYFGILFFILAFMPLFIKKKKHPFYHFFLGLGIVAILFSLGGNTPFYRLVYYLLPGAKKTRGPSMFFFVATLSFIVSGAMALNHILEKKYTKKEVLRYLSGWLGVFIFLLIVFSAGKGAIFSHWRSALSRLYSPDFVQNRLSTMHKYYGDVFPGVWRSIILLVLYLLSLVYIKKREWILPALSVLLLFDLWSVDRYYIQEFKQPHRYFAPDEMVRIMMKDTGKFRVFPLHYRRSGGVFRLNGIENVGGYAPNPLKRYQEFIGAGKSVMFQPFNFFKNPQFLDLAGAKYIIGIPVDTSLYPVELRPKVREWIPFYSRYREIGRGGGNSLYLNEHVFPRACLVPDYVVVEPESVLSVMGRVDLRRVLVLEEDPGVPHLKEVEGEVEVVEYLPNKIRLKAKMEKPGWVLFTDNYHPYWKLEVDGKPEKIFVADKTFRAFYLEKGEHDIVMRYISKPFLVGSKVSLIFAIFIVILVVVHTGSSIRRQKER